MSLKPILLLLKTTKYTPQLLLEYRASCSRYDIEVNFLNLNSNAILRLKMLDMARSTLENGQKVAGH